MLRSMLLGEPQVDPPVSVSSLLNKSDKMPLADSTETLTVREAITVQETRARDNDSASASDDRVDLSARRATSADSGVDSSAPKPARDESEPAIEAKAARSSNDKDKDAVVSATESERAQTEDDAVPEEPPAEKDARDAINGDDAIDSEKPTKGKKKAVSKEKVEPAAKAQEKTNGDDAVTKPAAGPEESVFEIERLATHRVNKDTSTVDFYVEWVGTATSWEPERELQSQVPDLVFEYWEAQGGREKATGLEEFHVFRILDSAVDPPTYRVQWVGYRDTPTDTTWEPRALLRRVAPIALGLYDSSNKKRTTKGRPGRPSKKAKTTRNADR